MPETEIPTVLAVDDDAAILHFIAEILEPAGYHVLPAPGGWRAIEEFAKAREPVRLLLTDVVMPDLAGPVLAAKLRAENPSLPVLFISGFQDTEIVRRFLSDRKFALLPKPFTRDGLLRAVAESLGHAPSH